MLDIKFVRENPEIVKQNIKNKFQDRKLPLVDEVIELDRRNREIKQEVEALRALRNTTSKQIGKLMGQGKREEAMKVKEEIAKAGEKIDALTEEERTSLIHPFRSARMTVRMSKFRNTVNRSYRILRFRITHRSWRALTELILRQPVVSQVTAFII